MTIHRIPSELAALAAVPITASTTSLVDVVTNDKLWTKLIGPFGGLMLSIVFLCIFLKKDSTARKDRLAAEEKITKANEVREAKEEERRVASEAKMDKRHTEMMEMAERQNKQLTALSVAGIRREAKTADAIKDLANKLDERPCAKLKKKKNENTLPTNRP